MKVYMLPIIFLGMVIDVTLQDNSFLRQVRVGSRASKDFDYTEMNTIINRYFAKSKPRQQYKSAPKFKVSVVKKSSKKRKIITVLSGQFTAGGIQTAGKFRTLKACQKACELSATCFAGDYNPWTQACFVHGNFTACGPLQPHPSLVHFKKTPCAVIAAPRGIVVLGVSVPLGVEVSAIKDLLSCIKACQNAGGGVASSVANVFVESQVCCNINYDFSTHKCYLHFCGIFSVDVFMLWCADPVTAPLNSIPHQSTVSISLCPPA